MLISSYSRFMLLCVEILTCFLRPVETAHSTLELIPDRSVMESWSHPIHINARMRRWDGIAETISSGFWMGWTDRIFCALTFSIRFG